jgi:uncharacterized membrane protein
LKSGDAFGVGAGFGRELSRKQAGSSVCPRYLEMYLIFLMLPTLSVLASYYQNMQLEMLAFVLLGSMVCVAVRRWEENYEDKIFSACLYSVSISLLMLGSLILPDGLLGWDIHTELYTFTLALVSGWNPTRYGVLQLSGVPLFNSVLSITILPIILNRITSLTGFQIFKFVFPLLFSFVPLVLYRVYRCFLSSRAAFVAAFLFVSYPAFYTELIGLGREEIAELMLVLLLAVFFLPKVSQLRSVRIVLILLTFGLVTAHYSLAFIYLGILAMSVIISSLWHKTRSLEASLSVLFAAVMIGLWYVFIVSPVAVLNFTRLSSLVLEGFLGNFFSFGARPASVFGLESSGGFSHTVNRYLQYFVMSILVLGFITVLRRKNSVEEEKMLPLMMVGMFLAGSIVALPFFAEALDVARTFHIALLFIAPCFAYGMSTLSRGFTRVRSMLTHHNFIGLHSKSWVWVCGLLFVYFIFSSGMIFTLANDTPTSPVLDLHRMMNSTDPNVVINFNSYYTNPEDVVAAIWLANYRGTNYVCVDTISGSQVLHSSGQISTSEQYPISTLPPTENCEIYSSVLNSRFGIWTTAVSTSSSAYGVSVLPTNILTDVTSVNKIYANGGSIIYEN